MITSRATGTARLSLMAIAAAIGAFGCASTPNEIKALGPRATAQVNRPYKDAANCLVRQMEEIMVYGLLKQGFMNQLRTYEAENYAEIIGESRTSGGRYVVNVSPRDAGNAEVKIFVSDTFLVPGAISADIEKAAAACVVR